MSVSTISINDTLLAQGLIAQDLPIAIKDMTGGYLSRFMHLTMLLNKQAGQQWNPLIVNKKEVFFQNKNYVGNTIASVAVVGQAMTITFNDVTYDKFINQDVVTTSNTNVKGLVVEHGLGFIKVMPVEGSTMASLVAEFTANKYIGTRYSSSPAKYSGATESRTYAPEYDYNFPSFRRVSQSWTTLDNQNSKPFFKDGTGAYRLYNDAARMKQFWKDLEAGWIYSNRSEEIVGGKQYFHNGGIDWAIKNRGGQVLEMTGALSQATWETFAGQIWDKNAANRNGDPLIIAGGRNGINTIRNFYTAQVLNTGILNTFGGVDVKGLNIPEISFNGMRFAFIELPFLNDPDYFPTFSSIPGLTGTTIKSNDIYVLDLSPVSVFNGTGISPAVEMFYFGKNPFGIAYIKGIADSSGVGMDELISMSYESYPITSADDAASWHVWHRGGVDFINAKFSGKIEFIA